MNIGNQAVRFHLSPEGKKALKGLVPAAGSFQAFVVEREDLGLVVNTRSTKANRPGESIPVMLLRWDYIATISFEYSVDGTPTRQAIGFSPG